ncbi:thiamine phosphate synthase [Elstera litoralis]|uniref:thiamine phosphate synthase n=1 Tax=Elstera litoralis TaxID=552518 RepID=UPI0006973727|nr:thiamine phosphate synthase [Elstera litoralis]
MSTNTVAELPARHYLILPASLTAEAFAQALAAREIACVALDTSGLSPAGLTEAVQRLLPIARAQEIAFLLTDTAGRGPVLEAILALDADGVHLASQDAYAEARKKLGPDRICGVFCGDSRHEAMEASEGGADYVAFTPDAELIHLWAEAMVVPCVAWDLPDDQKAPMEAAGAEFIAYRL